MNAQVNLKELVQKCMGDLVVANRLGLIEISDSEVLLRSDMYAVDVYADRDGVSLVYFDKSAKPIKGYNVFLFLINKRRNLLTFSAQKPKASSYADFVEIELSSLAQHLRDAGGDLLAGSKEWIKGYSWPALSPSGSVAAMI